MKNSILALLTFALFLTRVRAQSTDSLQKQLDTAQNACTKVELYTNIAASLIQFNQPKNRVVTYADAGTAIDYVLKAIHINSKFDDTLAIRNNFDCLAQAYIIQKKYTQAKWFILQSNAISRDRRDVPYIIKSLCQLANLKVTIKDYALAKKDLLEAIVLARYKNDVSTQIMVEKQLAALYDKTGNVNAAKELVKHYDSLAVALKKANEQRYIAMLKMKPKVKRFAILGDARQQAFISERPINDIVLDELPNADALLAANR